MEWYPIPTEGVIHDVYKESMGSCIIIRILDKCSRAEVSSNSKAVVRA